MKKGQPIKYKGVVSIKVRKGKKVVGKTTYHNEGNLPLFNFLAMCVKGEYAQVEALRPKYIKLFTMGESGTAVPPYTDFNDLVTNIAELESLNFPHYSGNPEIDSNNNKNYCGVKFKFVIPFSQIADYSDLNLLALYSQQNLNKEEDASAYIVIKKKVNNEWVLSDILKETGISGLSASQLNQYNLFLEWELIFMNEGTTIE